MQRVVPVEGDEGVGQQVVVGRQLVEARTVEATAEGAVSIPYPEDEFYFSARTRGSHRLVFALNADEGDIDCANVTRDGVDPLTQEFLLDPPTATQVEDAIAELRNLNTDHR